MSRILSLHDVRRTYGQPPVAACAGVSLSIDRGEFVAIVGPSGSGKSTLLNLIGTLDRPTSGTVEIDGIDVSRLSDRRLSGLRAHLIGVGLSHRLHHKPHQMSGGERQRVAIARAVVGDPPLLLADEPTGNLDSVSGASIVELLHELHEQGTTIVVITHDNDLAMKLPRQVAIKDGRIVHDSAAKEVAHV